MIHAPSRSGDLGYAGLLMRADDFFALGETPERYELINGVVVMSPSPKPNHWWLIEEVLFQIRAFSRAGGGGGFDTYAETDLYLDEQTVYRPDLCVYARPRASKAPLRLTTPPDLVVEINSPGNKAYDLVTKRDSYERFGVKEYWAIDPDAPPVPSDPLGFRVRSWRQEKGRFIESLVEGDTLPSIAIAGFGLNLVPLREMTR